MNKIQWFNRFIAIRWHQGRISRALIAAAKDMYPQKRADSVCGHLDYMKVIVSDLDKMLAEAREKSGR